MSRVHVGNSKRLWVGSTLSKSHAFGPRLDEAVLLFFCPAADSVADDRGGRANGNMDGCRGIALSLAGRLLAAGGLGLCGLNDARTILGNFDGEEGLGRRCEHRGWGLRFRGCHGRGRLCHCAWIQDRCACLRDCVESSL